MSLLVPFIAEIEAMVIIDKLGQKLERISTIPWYHSSNVIDTALELLTGGSDYVLDNTGVELVYDTIKEHYYKTTSYDVTLAEFVYHVSVCLYTTLHSRVIYKARMATIFNN